MSNTQTPLDLTAADRIARGRNQKRWLQQMLTPEGLDLWDCAPFQGAMTVYARLQAFVDNVACAGYAIQELRTGPNGSMRIFITGYVPAAAPSGRHPHEARGPP